MVFVFTPKIYFCVPSVVLLINIAQTSVHILNSDITSCHDYYFVYIWGLLLKIMATCIQSSEIKLQNCWDVCAYGTRHVDRESQTGIATLSEAQSCFCLARSCKAQNECSYWDPLQDAGPAD